MGIRDILLKDKTLKTAANKAKKVKFLAFATFFDADLQINLLLSSLELNDKYFTGDHMGWLSFLKHSSVKNYRKEFLDEISEKNAATALNEPIATHNTALKVKKMVESTKIKDDNSNIVVWMMPQKDYLGME